MTDMARLEAVVHGRVQGVGFRFHVLRTAQRLALTGWVANEPSGAVRVVAEGQLGDLQGLLLALRAGPPGAIVQRVDEAWSTPTGSLTGFEVRSGWHAGD